jgi:photosystem II stability/assembly factor-like uncharacterized protein
MNFRFATALAALLALAAPAPAASPAKTEHDLYACSLYSRNFTVGQKVKDSGLHFRWSEYAWSLLGFNHLQLQSLDYDPRDPRTLYIAAGNGLFRSRDSGVTWRQTTDESVTELQAVAVDPNRPDDVYIALSDGIAVSRDQAATWSRLSLPTPRRFTKALRIDRTRAGRILAALEQGIFLSEDSGATWREVAQADQPTHLEQSPADTRHWIATAQRGGMLQSRDGGLTWTPVPGIAGNKTLYQAIFDPTNARRIAVAGWDAGVQVSEDGGATWAPRDAGLPFKRIERIAFDPDHAGRLYAGVHEEALFASDDAGRTWHKDGLDGSIVSDLVFVPRPSPPTASRDAAFRERTAQVINFWANPADPNSGNFMHIAARLYQHRDADWASRRLIELLKDQGGDMFWMYPTTSIAYLGRGQLTPEAQSALRFAWKTYMPYRGDTENHWLLYYSSLYLMAQYWPDLPGSEWFNGKSSIENLHESERWIDSWFELTLTKGQGEYDCTHYLGVYLLPIAHLAHWSADSKMQTRARMMLDWLIADYAAENLNGTYVGSHARTDDRAVLEKSYTAGSDFGWLLFGLGRPTPGYGYAALHYALSAAYLPPEVIHQIATDRSHDYVQRELKRTRHRWRFNDQRNGPVYKTTYMRADYAVGSDQGGVLQPIQQHSWDVTWAVPDGRGVHNTIFSMHPYSSLRELQTYFSQPADVFIEAVVRSKRSYDSPDKFLGGSPYEQIFQDLDTVIALYNIPPGTRFPHIHGFFSKDLARLEEDPSGWIFCQGGNAYIAYRPLAPFEWRPIVAHDWMAPGAERGGRRLYSPHLKNGTVVQVASASEFADFDAFKKAILALPFKFTLDPVPSVTMRSLRGHDLAFTWGQPRDWSGWKAFDSPYMQSEPGSRILTLRHGALRRTLDFNTLTVADGVN